MKAFHTPSTNTTKNIAAHARWTGAEGRFDLHSVGRAIGMNASSRIAEIGTTASLQCRDFELRTLVSSLTLCGALALSGGAAWAKSPTLNPAKLGPFCPPDSELADATHTNILSAREQAQIKKIVHGFMDLEATARRSVGHPLGPIAYWDKGYTAKFDVSKDVPGDGLRYIAYRYSNTCSTKDGALATILFDVADFSGRKIKEIFQTPDSFVSPQSYWDAFSKTAITLPDEMFSPEQPIIFTVLPLYKSEFGKWLIEQSDVPLLRRIIKTELREEVLRINKYYQCDAQIPRSPGTCALNENNKKILAKYSRPAWSIYPTGIKN